jgi:RNA polymerase sigma-70 factor (ECF subfamily)
VIDDMWENNNTNSHAGALPRTLTEIETEHHLVRRVLAGETELFAELIQRCEKRIRTVIRYALGNRAEADDIAQEARLKAFKHLSQFRYEARFRTWVSRIAANEANQFLRSRTSTLTRSLDSEASSTDNDLRESRLSAYELILRTEISSNVQRAIRKLPKGMRAVVVLKDLEYLTNDEAALRLGLTATAVKTRYFRARLRLRQFLTGYYRRTLATSKRTNVHGVIQEHAAHPAVVL